jgi:hypothetical protein
MVAHALCYMIGLCDALELLHTWRKATLNTEASLNRALAGHYVKGLRLWSVKHDSNAAAESYRIGIKVSLTQIAPVALCLDVYTRALMLHICMWQ